MRKDGLEKLFNPHSIAVIGASNKPSSVGGGVFNNLRQGGFDGELFPVNPKYKEVQDHQCFSSISEINQAIDLAVIIIPAITIPKIITECGEKEIRYALIISAGFSELNEEGKRLEQQVLELAQKFGIRFVGPNCLGLMRSSIGLNATFGNSPILPGKLAFVSQSGALCAATLDWAVGEKIGFSTVISLGNSADIGFGDALDYLALDDETDCVLLYIEGIRHAASFMKGLHAAAAVKPVIAIKAGRNSQGSQAAISHTAAIVGADDVFDAALRRAGVVRVMGIKQLFTAAKVFSNHRRLKGNKLVVVTNGGGAAVMAADRAADLNIPLPKLTQKTKAQLKSVLPHREAYQNPLDILGDATSERYRQVLNVCLQDKNCDGLLATLVPVATSNPIEIAKQIVELNKQTNKPILACWMGREQVKSSWELFAKHKIPYFSIPETAIEAFSYLVNQYRNQQLWSQTSEALSLFPLSLSDSIMAAQSIINHVISENRKILTMLESKALLKTFGIPVTEAFPAKTVAEALIIAKSIGFPVVMKINSPHITHKQDVDGVQLNVANIEAVKSFFNQMMKNARKKQPNAKILGVTLEKMYKTPTDRELMVGVLQDSAFGAAIVFGAGGSLVEIMQDRALELPPLNPYLIRKLIDRTRIAKLLNTFRNKPPVNMKAIEDVLLRVSAMVESLPQLGEMDINPLLVNDQEIIAVDARISIKLSM